MNPTPWTSPRLFLAATLVSVLLLSLGCKGNLSKYDSESGGSAQAPERPNSGGTFIESEGGQAALGRSFDMPTRGVVRSDGSIDPEPLCQLMVQCIPGESAGRCTRFAKKNPPTSAEARHIARCIDTSAGCQDLLSCLGISPDAIANEAERREKRARKR